MVGGSLVVVVVGSGVVSCVGFVCVCLGGVVACVGFCLCWSLPPFFSQMPYGPLVQYRECLWFLGYFYPGSSNTYHKIRLFLLYSSFFWR